MQKTKMIFTIGPASDSEEVLREFIKIGMSAARLNFSHGTHETHKEKIDLIKRLREEMGSSTAIILDIKGPKIRTHNFENEYSVPNSNDGFDFQEAVKSVACHNVCKFSCSRPNIVFILLRFVPPSCFE